jgi:hypothetical protein
MRMWWLSVVSSAFCIMDVLVCVDQSYGVMKTDHCVLCVLKFSACALCSGSRNYFVIYHILTYE